LIFCITDNFGKRRHFWHWGLRRKNENYNCNILNFVSMGILPNFGNITIRGKHYFGEDWKVLLKIGGKYV